MEERGWNLEAVSRNNPGHALELVEVVLVSHESITKIPEDKEKRRKYIGEPQKPVAGVGMSCKSAENK